MTSEEEVRLRKLYATWPDDRLVRGAYFERVDYTAEAVGCMLEELERRGVRGESLDRILRTLPPSPDHAKPSFRETIFRPWYLSRKQYLLRWSFWFVVSTGLDLLSRISSPRLAGVLFGSFVLSNLYRIIAFDVARLRSMGWTPGWAVFMLLPGPNLVLMGLLFVVPPEK